MKVGHLFRAPLRTRGVAGFQLLRVVIVTGLAATGSYALSLSVDDKGFLQESVAVVKQQNDSASAPNSIENSHQTTFLQVMNAELVAPDPTSGGTVPLIAPSELTHENAHAEAIVDTGNEHAAPALANPSSEVQRPELEQASSEPSSATSSDMTGTVRVANTASDTAQEGDLVDLNTAPFEQLNALRDAGPIGRAIIKGRPYASVEDLVKRKVLRRSVYEKIKDQVTVR